MSVVYVFVSKWFRYALTCMLTQVNQPLLSSFQACFHCQRPAHECAARASANTHANICWVKNTFLYHLVLLSLHLVFPQTHLKIFLDADRLLLGCATISDAEIPSTERLVAVAVQPAGALYIAFAIGYRHADQHRETHKTVDKQNETYKCGIRPRVHIRRTLTGSKHACYASCTQVYCCMRPQQCKPTIAFLSRCKVFLVRQTWSKSHKHCKLSDTQRDGAEHRHGW